MCILRTILEAFCDVKRHLKGIQVRQLGKKGVECVGEAPGLLDFPQGEHPIKRSYHFKQNIEFSFAYRLSKTDLT